MKINNILSFFKKVGFFLLLPLVLSGCDDRLSRSESGVEVSLTAMDTLESLMGKKNTIYFDLNKTETHNEEYLTMVKNAAEFLTQHRELTVVIYGRVDAQGTEQINRQVAFNRALYVARMLIKHGVKVSQIYIKADITQKEGTTPQEQRKAVLVFSNKKNAKQRGLPLSGIRQYKNEKKVRGQNKKKKRHNDKNHHQETVAAPTQAAAPDSQHKIEAQLI